MHPRGITGYILRLVQFTFAVIVLGLSGALVASQPTGGSPSQINYAVFTAVFALLTWFWIMPTSILAPDTLGSPFICLILDAVNALFFFAGGIALAVAIRVRSCTNEIYLHTNRFVAGETRRCSELQALTAFMWFGTSPLVLD